MASGTPLYSKAGIDLLGLLTPSKKFIILVNYCPVATCHEI